MALGVGPPSGPPVPHNLEHPTEDDFAGASQARHVLPAPWVEPVDVAIACAFLCSDDARCITGVGLPIDAGMLIKRREPAG